MGMVPIGDNIRGGLCRGAGFESKKWRVFTASCLLAIFLLTQNAFAGAEAAEGHEAGCQVLLRRGGGRIMGVVGVDQQRLLASAPQSQVLRNPDASCSMEGG